MIAERCISPGASAEPTAPPQPAPAVEAARIGHRFHGHGGPVEAIAEVDLAVSSGELVAILGPSGCGKSTLLRILGGLVAPTTGAARLGGETPAAARASQGIGWLAQEDGLLPWLTVAENVALPGRVGARRAVVTTEAVRTILRQVGLADSAHRYPHQLSGGMRQRAALARALVVQPRLLFLDEPFASLDELTREILGDLVLDARAARRPTTVLVTHSVVEAVRLADRAIVLSPRPARIVADLRIDLDRPRRYDVPGFGRLVQEIKSMLTVAPDLMSRTAERP